jgi:hypothetical protein
MNDEEKMLYLFKLKHGEMTGACSAEVIYPEDYGNSLEPQPSVACMKHGEICWTESRESLLFFYITKDL